MTQFADLTALQSLGTAKVSAVAATAHRPGPNGADTASTVTVTNTSNKPIVGFFLRSDIRRGNTNGTERPGDNEVTSGLWSDNDITLWPGESQTMTVSYRAADLHGATPVISISGFNVGRIDVVAPNTPTAWAHELAAAGAPGVLHIDAKE
jgi:exo-1,4-beta-D-glucosaminidase